jgi:hypothetical protein
MAVASTVMSAGCETISARARTHIKRRKTREVRETHPVGLAHLEKARFSGISSCVDCTHSPWSAAARQTAAFPTTTTRAGNLPSSPSDERALSTAPMSNPDAAAVIGSAMLARQRPVWLESNK